ncbi:MAG: glycosyltransferase [Candidatus Pedobacter colombiensis]|uniref:Glycosyltransferase n=1 Tax=Candidatus Pedobacter colombiensis TaxID=3121371 RepID=A0AAJ5WD03_9SPHI|nr:glycosyltransferase [Pedobacter sp.]WEK21280.1 MAG: glycosyltransferase [Pedobacter sp.]
MYNDEIIVSVCCITYNHEKYIAAAIESFLMQETEFRYEILIGDDCSTDNTRKIIEMYCERYPGRIRLISPSRNLGGIRNQIALVNRANGKYIAMCDGDDFWTDPFKLQKQVDFLEANPDYVICCHYTKVIDDNYNTKYVHPSPVPLEFTYEDLLFGKREETRICSLMVNNTAEVRSIGKEHWYFDTYGADVIFKLHATLSTRKKIYVLPEVMGCYRIHAGGIWSMALPRIRKRRMINDFNLVIKKFSYSSFQKRELLKIYMKQYFLFDLRSFKIENAFKTIATLL